MFNSQIDKVQPEQVVSSQVQPIDTTYRPAIANTLPMFAIVNT